MASSHSFFPFPVLNWNISWSSCKALGSKVIKPGQGPLTLTSCWRWQHDEDQLHFCRALCELPQMTNLKYDFNGKECANCKIFIFLIHSYHR